MLPAYSLGWLVATRPFSLPLSGIAAAEVFSHFSLRSFFSASGLLLRMYDAPCTQQAGQQDPSSQRVGCFGALGEGRRHTLPCRPPLTTGGTWFGR